MNEAVTDSYYMEENNTNTSDMSTLYESKVMDKITENSAKNILLYKNGDKYFPAKRFVVNRKYIRTWDTFLEELTKSLQPRNGVIRDIRTPFHGTRIRSLNDLIVNGSYVAVPKGEIMKLIDYANVVDVKNPNYRTKQYNPIHKPLKYKSRDINKIENKFSQPMYTKGDIIYIYRNGDPFTRGIKIVVNQFARKHMNTLVRAIEERVLLPTNRPIRRLYTMKGDIVRYAKDIEDGHYYVAASNERFENIKYGQYLPTLRGGKFPSGRFRIKYLNQSPAAVYDSLSPNPDLMDVAIRRSIRSVQSEGSTDQKQETARNENKPEIVGLNERKIAANKIQSAFRSYVTRKEIQKARENNAPLPKSRFRHDPIRIRPQKNNSPLKSPISEKPKERKEYILKQKDQLNSEKVPRSTVNVTKSFENDVQRSPSLKDQNQISPKDSISEEVNQNNEMRAEEYKKVIINYNKEKSDQAAFTIQSAFRGHKTRTELDTRLESEWREEAAIIIQNGYKTYRTRKQKKIDEIKGESTKIIQAFFRGFKYRNSSHITLEQDKADDNKIHEGVGLQF